jgi:hypothetical protein
MFRLAITGVGDTVSTYLSIDTRRHTHMAMRHVLIASLLITFAVGMEPATADTREHVLGGRALTSGTALRRATSVDGSADARAVVDRIVGAIGIPMTRFDVRASRDVANAEATTENDGKDRIILYNPDWMNTLKSSTTNWSDWVVMAHEVGHHVAFHMDPSFPSHEAELQADYFAGFILHKLGAPLVDVQLAMAMVSSDQSTLSHPARHLRVAEIKKGWEAAARNVGVNVIPASLTVPRPQAAPVAAVRMEQRAALLIGNSHYTRWGVSLKNPKNDVLAVGRMLRKLGFATTVVYDGTSEQIATAIGDFRAEAAEADWAVIYYAGTGIEVDGTNYMIPVDADDRRARSFTTDHPQMRLDTAFDAVRSAKLVRLVVVDACRVDPVAETAVPAAGRRERLRVVEPPSGVVVAYSTAAGQYAEDGAGDLSPFAQALIGALREPGIELPKVFRRVSADVTATTQGRQVPSVLGNWPADDLPVARP